MVEVFSTNVNNETAARQIVGQLHTLFVHCKANFDLDDCDRILRVCYEEYIADLPERVIWLLAKNGYLASILEDDFDPITLNKKSQK